MDVLQLLKENKVEEALEYLALTKNSARLVLADYRNEKKLLDKEFIKEEAFEAYKQSLISRIANLPDEPDDLTSSETAERVAVFLSYNRQDTEVALRIKTALKGYGIRVRMDVEDVAVGQSIEEFVAEQTRSTNAVILLISENSLASGWIGYESALAIFNKKVNHGLLLPLSVNDFFLQSDAGAETARKIDTGIARFNASIRERLKMNLSAKDLEEEKDRLLKARTQLPDLLEKLKSVDVAFIDGEKFDTAIKRTAERLLTTKKAN